MFAGKHSLKDEVFMKFSTTALALIVAAGLAATSTTAFSSRNAGTATLAAPPTSVAIVDMQKAINDSTEIKARNEALKVRAEARMAELDKFKKDLKDLVESAKLLPEGSPEAVKARAEAVVKNATLEAQFQAYKQLTDIESGDILGDIHAKVIAAVDAIAKRDGYQLVLADDRAIVPPKGRPVEDVGSAINQRRVLYADPAIDITARVLTAMNNEYEAGKSK